MTKRFAVLLAAGSVLTGCVNEQGIARFGTAGTNFSSFLGTSSGYLSNVRTQKSLTIDSDDFLRNRPDSAQAKKQCPTNLDTEIKLTKERIAIFNNIIAPYTALIESYLKNDTDYQKYAESIKGFAGSAIDASNLNKAQSAFLRSLLPFADQFVTGATEFERAYDGSKIVKFARENQKKFDNAIDDLKRSFASVDDIALAEITTWEECERHRLRYIYSDENVTMVEMAAMFETFHVKSTALRAAVGTNNSDEILDELKKAHADLASGTVNLVQALALGTRLNNLAKASKEGVRSSNDALVATRTKLTD